MGIHNRTPKETLRYNLITKSISMKQIDAIEPYSNYHEEVAPFVWLMDNHKWAYWAWEHYRFKNNNDTSTNLVHLDYHWDAVNDWQTEEKVSRLVALSSLLQVRPLLEKVKCGESEIHHDNFIAPAIIRGLVSEVHFHCFQKNNECGFHDIKMMNPGASQIIHSDIDQLVQTQDSGPVFFDLDIDYFKYSDVWGISDHWPDEEIHGCLSKCENLIKNAKVVTIAMSFGYSGEEYDTRRVTELILCEILKYRDAED